LPFRLYGSITAAIALAPIVSAKPLTVECERLCAWDGVAAVAEEAEHDDFSFSLSSFLSYAILAQNIL
jgi:hypothetical protein